jgi:hypothetical protein
MDNRFRKLFLQHIEDLMNKEPSSESLVKLLQLGKPEFTEEDSSNEPARVSAFRVLKGLIHPDKHPADCSQLATSLFQTVQEFYDKCCIVIIAHGTNNNGSVRRRNSPTSVNYPLQFHVKDQWPFLAVVEPTMSMYANDPGLIARLIAYKCINFRGAIAHGKSTELFYSNEQVSGFMEYKSVKDAFHDAGGSKVLSDIDAVKEELMNRGPVVSTSFTLSQAFLNACEHPSSFDPTQIGQTHPLVIVGWKLTACGEMWLVRSIDGSSHDIPIAFGQFSVDDECVAPLDTFEQMPWQDHTKTFDICLGDEDWYSWKSVVSYVDHSGLADLATVLGGSIFGKSKIVLRDKDKIARSRWAKVTDVSWSDDCKKWKVSATFVE